MRLRARFATLAGLAAAAATALIAAAPSANPPKAPERVFELRTYVANPGKLGALNARFRDHTCKLFQKHGIELIGFWTPQDDKDGKADTLIYVLAYPSREAAKKSWEAFGNDPEWKKAREESEKDGKILAKPPTSVYLDPTDYSPIK